MILPPLPGATEDGYDWPTPHEAPPDGRRFGLYPPPAEETV